MFPRLCVVSVVVVLSVVSVPLGRIGRLPCWRVVDDVAGVGSGWRLAEDYVDEGGDVGDADDRVAIDIAGGVRRGFAKDDVENGSISAPHISLTIAKEDIEETEEAVQTEEKELTGIAAVAAKAMPAVVSITNKSIIKQISFPDQH